MWVNMENTKLKENTEVIQLDEHSKPQEPNACIKYGEDVFANLTPLCEVACIVTTPTKKTLKCRTKYIGMHSNNVLLLEMPDVTAQELAVFMNRGYQIQACVVGDKGEGARIYFKSKIEYVLNGGGSGILLVTLPKATQIVLGLRESARLELTLDAILDPDGHRYLCQIRDISRSGCLIVLDRMTSNYRVGNLITLALLTEDFQTPKALRAIIKNVEHTSQYKKYGAQFEQCSIEYVKTLIEKLSFCHIQQKFEL